MTNALQVARALETVCTGLGGSCSRVGGGSHAACSSRIAREAAIYPKELCRAMLKGIRNQLREDGVLKNGCCGIQAPDDDAEIERQLRGPLQGYSGNFKDDLTGQVLKDEFVRAARAAELAYFHSKKV